MLLDSFLHATLGIGALVHSLVSLLGQRFTRRGECLDLGLQLSGLRCGSSQFGNLALHAFVQHHEVLGLGPGLVMLALHIIDVLKFGLKLALHQIQTLPKHLASSLVRRCGQRIVMHVAIRASRYPSGAFFRPIELRGQVYTCAYTQQQRITQQQRYNSGVGCTRG